MAGPSLSVLHAVVAAAVGWSLCWRIACLFCCVPLRLHLGPFATAPVILLADSRVYCPHSGVLINGCALASAPTVAEHIAQQSFSSHGFCSHLAPTVCRMLPAIPCWHICCCGILCIAARPLAIFNESILCGCIAGQTPYVDCCSVVYLLSCAAAAPRGKATRRKLALVGFSKSVSCQVVVVTNASAASLRAGGCWLGLLECH